MNFLAPIFLVFIAAAAVPLLVHLLRRRMDVRVDFPAARYLARAERENSRRLRLRNLLLMLLRVAAVIFIAAAAARPVGKLAGTGHAPTALAFVLDNTLSTSAIRDGRAVLEHLKDAARTAIAAASPSDQLWLITADGQVTGGNAGTLQAALDRVQPLAGAGAPREAIVRAAAMLGASPLGERRLGVLTDGQATSWTEITEVGLPDTPVMLLAPRFAPTANRAVTFAEARPARWTPRGEVVARVTSEDSTSYRVLLGERTLARGTASPGEEILVRAAPPERGWLAGTVELQPDELRGDDVRHFAVSVGQAPGVRIGPGAGPFVRSAVDALVEGDRVVSGDALSIVAADELTVLPALIVPPSDPVRLGAANRALERAGVPWRFGALRSGASAVRAVHETGWDSARVTAMSRYVLEARRVESADTLATAGGEPWIVSGDRYVLIASPLDPSATDLPIRAIFVPWLASTLTQRLAGGGGRLIESVPSATIRRPSWADALDGAQGQRTTLSASTFIAPAQSGVFFLLRGGERAGALVVNGDPSESDLARLDDTALRGRIRSDDVSVIDDAGRWSRMLFGAADRRPLAIPFLITAIVALLAESVLAGAGGRRGT